MTRDCPLSVKPTLKIKIRQGDAVHVNRIFRKRLNYFEDARLISLPRLPVLLKPRERVNWCNCSKQNRQNHAIRHQNLEKGIIKFCKKCPRSGNWGTRNWGSPPPPTAALICVSLKKWLSNWSGMAINKSTATDYWCMLMQ